MKKCPIGLDKSRNLWYNTHMKNNDEKRFWIGFDGFDLSKSWAKPLHFSTWEEADEYKHAHLPELLRLCEYLVTVYENPSDPQLKIYKT